MKKSALLLLFLSACASAHPTYLQDGSRGYRIDCSGNAGNMGQCVQKAGETCGASGYKVLEKSAETKNQVTINGGGLANFLSSPENQRFMVVRCNN